VLNPLSWPVSQCKTAHGISKKNSVTPFTDAVSDFLQSHGVAEVVIRTTHTGNHMYSMFHQNKYNILCSHKTHFSSCFSSCVFTACRHGITTDKEYMGKM